MSVIEASDAGGSTPQAWSNEAAERAGAAEAALQAGDLDAALAEFERLASEFPSSARVLNGLGLAARKRGDLGKARDGFRAACEVDPANPWFRNSLASALQALGATDEARREYEAALHCKPDFAAAHEGLAQLARERGDARAALAHLRDGVRADPENLWLRCAEASELAALGERERAEAVYNAALACNAAYSPALTGLARLAQRRGDHEAAASLFRRALAAEPHNLWLESNLASELLALGRDEEASAAFESALAKNPAYAPALHGWGQIAARRGQPAEALARLSAASELAPDDLWFLCAFAAELAKQGQAEAASQAYERAFERNPRFALALNGLGGLAQARGDPAAAHCWFARACEAEPNNPWFRCSAAHALAALGRTDEAQRTYEAALEIDPYSVAAHEGLGRIAARAGDPERALRHFESARALNPDSPWIRAAIGEQQIALGRVDEAQQTFEALLARDPSFPATHNGLGRIAQSRADHERALAHFLRFAELEPQNPWPLCAAAAQYRELCRFREAVATARRNVAAHPEAAAPLLELGRCLKEAGEVAQVLPTLEMAALIEPENSAVACAIAAEHLRVGRSQEATRGYERVLHRDGRCVHALIGLGLVARQFGDRESALSCFRKAAAAAPARGALEAVRELMIAYRWEEAHAVLQDALETSPNDRGLRMQLGFWRRATGARTEARDVFLGLTEAYPSFPEPALELAREEMALGALERAIAAVRSALERKPDHPATLELLAELLQEADRTADAKRVLLALLVQRPGMASTTIAVARLEARQGRCDRALVYLDGLHARHGGLPEVYAAKAQILADAGLFAESNQVLQQALNAFPQLSHLVDQRIALAIACADDVTATALLNEAIRESGEPTRDRAAKTAWLLANVHAVGLDFEAALRCASQAMDGAPENPSHAFFAARAALLCFDVEETERHLNVYARLSASRARLKGASVRAIESFVGQMLVEWRLEPQAIAQIVAAKGMIGGEKLSALSENVLQFEGCTAASLALCIEMRRSGGFDPAAGVGRAIAESPVPRTIGQYWDEPELPADLSTLRETWAINNPGFELRLFCDQSALEFLARRYPRPVAQAFVSAREPAQKADVFRLAYLFAEGGFYADIDDRCVGPLDCLGATDVDLVTYQEDIGSIGNNFLGAKAREPRIGRALEHAVASVLRGDSEMLWLSTGPGLLTRVIAHDIARRGGASEVRVLSRGELFRSVRIHCPAAYKVSPKHWSRTAFARTRSTLDGELTDLMRLALNEPDRGAVERDRRDDG